MNRNSIPIFIFIIFWFFLILINLLKFQLIEYKFYYKKSLHIKKIKIEPKRGTIYDINGNILAASYEEYTGRVALDSKNIKFTEEDVINISKLLEIPENNVRNAVKMKRGFVIIAKDIEASKLKEIEELKIKGLIIEKKYKRFYPYSNLLSHIIGWTSYDGDGISGLEYFYNNKLKGKEGEIFVFMDRKRNSYDLGIETKKAIEGQDLKTSIDLFLQYKLKKILLKLKEKINYEWASITVSNPKNGEIYAHTIDPPFNEELKEIWQDEHLASSPYEPGSILKPFFAECLLRNGFEGTNKLYECQKGYIEVLGKKIRDHHVFKKNLNFNETLIFSSNVGCIIWSLKIPINEFLNTIKSYGFLEKTGVEVPAEAKGRIESKFETFNKLSQAYVTLGQGISVTTAQIIRAYSALLNGGYLVTPHFNKNFIKKEKMDFKPEYEKLKPIFFQTILNGTGSKAYIQFIPMGGKTGTGQISEGGKYVYGNYMSSFVCFFPIDSPRYLVMVVVKKPKPLFYGGDVAAPVAKDVIFYLFLKDIRDEIV